MKNIKLPNSYGGVIKMGNASRRRRPYMVRITTGYEINEKQENQNKSMESLDMQKQGQKDYKCLPTTIMHLLI